MFLLCRNRRQLSCPTLTSILWLLLVASPSIAQNQQSSPEGLWRTVPAVDVAGLQMARAVDGEEGYFPNTYRLFELTPNILTRLTDKAPPEIEIRANAERAADNQITLPMPNGTFRRFTLIESPVMSEELARKFPNIQSYRGHSIDDAMLSMRMDVSPAGLHAQILGPGGTTIINPTNVENRYVTFSKRFNGARSQPFQCSVDGRTPEGMARGATSMALPSGDLLRSYRLAVACTGEYAQKFGGSVENAMAAINTTVNRVTGIYEREAAIRLVLVDNNDQLIHTDSQNDPFNNDDANALITQSQRVIDRIIGDANYDVGHTFSTGAGGLAGLGVVGVRGQKARGVTGRDNPVGDPFDVDYVAHELGHQFGGDHTFNGKAGFCSGGNRNAATAVEPGSGSTIQAYAGICQSDDLQRNSDPFFHAISLSQIIAHTTLGAGNVVTPQPTGNTIPFVDAGSSHTIPKQTPFKLTANGGDLDGDRLLYCWEQMDIGPAAALGTPDDGSIPLFRSFNPTTRPWRVFPRWSDVLNQSSSLGEQLPSHSRTMNFRVTVRDNRSGGGGINSDDIAIRVHDQAGPFRVTSPTQSSLDSNLVDVRWDVANTDQAPIHCDTVHIRLSTDGGQTFPELLSNATPNDGHELVAIPSIAVNNLRLMVESSDNVFFAVSPTNFSIQTSKQQIYLTRHAEKRSGDDPDVTSQGETRARRLADLMSRIGITRVYSTNFRRTQQTAAPTATAAGIDVNIYDAAKPLATEIKGLLSGERVLVVGHSNTLVPIATALGVNQTISIDENTYDNLLFVGLGDGQLRFAHYKYDVPEQSDESTPTENVASRRSAAPLARGMQSPEMQSRSELTAKSINSVSSRAESFDQGLQTPMSRSGSSAPQDRFALSDLPVVYLNQNWTPNESLEFYRLRQGSPLVRKDFFDALEQPETSELFRESEYLSRFGFLPQRPHQRNPEGYPIGFTGDESLEFTCAACHTSRLTVAGKEYWIDGSQAMTDVGSWLGELVRAIKLTVADAPDLQLFQPATTITLDQNTKFGRFASRLLDRPNSTAAQLRIITELLQRDLDRREQYNDYNNFGKRFTNDDERNAATKHPQYGFGRLDALGAILNQACAETLERDGNAAAANAPVNYPAVWDAPQHTHVQWNGAVDNTSRFGPLGRNAGQVIGVFGIVHPDGALAGYDSSINFDALNRAEELLTKLWSPLWPNEFGIDQALVAAGKPIYRRNCITCHALMDRRDPNRRVNDVLVPIETAFGPWPALGTDALTAKNWNDRTAEVGLLAGRNQTLPFQGRFPRSDTARVPAREVLTHLVFKSIARSFVPWRDELTIDDARQRSIMFEVAATQETLMRYKSRPLNGVWSTAPYLHNGSVPDMVELLKEPTQRKSKFRVGTTTYDPSTLGYKDEGPFEFDASLPGNSNTGHAYGTTLSEQDKTALIEFIKSL
ncbi:di-heme-cytochrome C peroxidase [Novipirellula sp. SH528]|uniref:di-heme-cytochrome C peroxidase n=1 Tax=Novipirellula sp. SH528 TaxID=3454466 RepID=UPI003FA0D2DC